MGYRLRWIVALALIGAGGASRSAEESPLKYASPIRTLVCVGEVVQRNDAELKQMGSSFSQAYRFTGSNIWYEEPLKLRLESTAGKFKVTYVINGDRKKATGAGLSKTWNIKGQPGRLQTLSTVGLATPSWLALCNAKYIGTEVFKGRVVKVFELKYRDAPDGSWFRVSLDPETRTMPVMKVFSPEGKLKVTYHFMKPVKTRGVHVPTRIEVFSPRGVLAAVTEVRGIVVDQPIDGGRFAL
jgi:hypothetical protein